MDFDKATLAANLRALRAKKRLSQSQVAKAIGVNAQTIINYESESAPNTPTLETAWGLCDLFGVTLDELGGRVPPSVSPRRKEPNDERRTVGA